MATAWLESSGVALADGVVCDHTCATNVPGVYALGDVARFHDTLFDEPMRVEHWSNAVEQAQLVAATLVGAPAPAAQPPYFWSDQHDVKLQFVGRVAAGDHAEVAQGTLDQRSYVVAYGRQGRRRGVLASNAPKQLIRGRKLLAERASFDAALSAVREAQAVGPVVAPL